MTHRARLADLQSVGGVSARLALSWKSIALSEIQTRRMTNWHESDLTFAFGDAAGVQVSRGGSLRAGLALQLTLLVLVGAEPAANTLVMFHREVGPHWTLDCIRK